MSPFLKDKIPRGFWNSLESTSVRWGEFPPNHILKNSFKAYRGHDLLWLKFSKHMVLLCWNDTTRFPHTDKKHILVVNKLLFLHLHTSGFLAS